MKKEKEITPILTSTDHMEFDRHLFMIRNRLIPLLEKIKVEFLKLKIGPFDNEFLDDILFGNFKLIIEKMSEQIREDAPSRFLKGEAVNTANKMIGRLHEVAQEIKHPGNMELPVILDYPSVDDSGNIILTDEAIDSLKQFHSTYCITERGQELLGLHKAAAEAINKFYQLAKDNLSNNSSEIGELFFFDMEGNIIATSQDYDWYMYARQPNTVAQ